MANVDNLNFGIILNDEDFNKKINEDIELAKKLNVELSTLLNVKAQVGRTNIVGDATKTVRLQKATADAAAAQERLKTATTNAAAAQERLATASTNAATAQERLQQSQMRTEQLTKRITDQTKKQNKAYLEQSRIFKELKGYALGYLSLHGASNLLSSLVKVTGEFELQKTTLAAMLGDLNKAEQIITRIQGLAVESPFQFKELTTYAKQLSAFSVPAEELYETTKMLADVSAGLGVGMDRIVLAYGQVRSAAFLRGQEVRQFTEAGIPILDELAKQFTELEGRAVSTGEVFDKISARLVPFEMVAKVFKDMTSEGGKFYNMQEVQAETLRGKISNLKDAYEVLLNEIGKSQSENLKNAVDWARRLMQNYEETGRKLVELIAAYGAYKAAIIAMEVVSGTFALANHKVLKSLVNIGKVLTKNPYAVIAAGITALGFSIYKSATQLEAYEKIQKSLANTNKKFSQSLNTEQAKLEMLYNNLKLAKEGTKEYDKARKAIYANYASYISDLKNEGIAVDNLAGVYDKLKEKVEASTKARFRGVAAEGVNSTYGSVTQGLLSETERATERLLKKTAIEFDSLQKQAIQAYVSGVLSMEDLESDSRLQQVAGVLKMAAESGNDEWMQFGTSIEYAQQQFSKATNTWVEQMAAIDEVYGKMEDTLDKDGKWLPPFGGDDDGEAENRIQSEIDAVRRLKDAYDTLAPYMNGEMLRKTLTALFPNADQQLIESLDFRGKLVELAGQLNQFDQEASQKLLDSISGEKASEIASTFKAIEQYKKTIDSWMGEDFNLTGEGVTFDISKIIRDLNNQYAKINEKAIKASDLLTKAQMGDEEALKVVREVYGEEVWQKYLTNGKAVIDELARKEREASRKTADEKIRDLASKYVKEQMDEKNIALSDFEDKSIAQVQSLIDRMNEIKDEAKKLADEALVDVLLGKIDDGQYARWQMLLNVIEQVEQKIEDVQEEKDKKQWDNVIAGAESVSQLSEEFINLGEAIGNTKMSKLGNDLKKATETFAGVLKAFEAKDTISMITNLVSYAISEISSIFTAVYDHQKALNDALKEYRDLILDIRRESYSGIFGTDEMALAAENAKILAEQQKLYEEQVQKVQKVKFQKFGGSFWRKDSIEGALQEAADSQGWDLFLENGTYNIKALEAYFDAYSSSLTKKQRDIVQDLIESGKALDDASAQQAQYLTDLFSGVADNIASSMVDAFIESGDAAADMGNIVSDVAKQMVADLIKSIYLMPILNKYQKKAQAINQDANLSPTQKTEAQLALLDNALREISLQSTAINDTIERFEGYFDEGKAEGDGFSNGIKGMTEDTAGLLASYINAMRADLSLMKGLQAKYLPIIGESMPTLLDYLARIQANTFDLAQSNAEILQETQKIAFELQSVMGFGDEGRAIRILS